MNTNKKQIKLGNIAVRNRTKEQILDAIDLQVENTLDIDMMQIDAYESNTRYCRTYITQINGEEIIIDTHIGWDSRRLWMGATAKRENKEFEYTLIAEGNRTVYHR